MLNELTKLRYIKAFEGLSIKENLSDGNSKVSEIFEFIKDKLDEKLND